MDKKREKIDKIQMWVFLIGFAVLFILFLNGLYQRSNDNQTFVFFRQGENYMADFFNVLSYAQGLRTYEVVSGERAYFPMTYVIFHIFGKLMGFDGYDGTLASISFLELTVSGFIMTLMMALLAIQLFDMLQKKKIYKFLISAFLMVSGVSLFSYERGNVILLAVSGMIFFLATYESENKVMRELGYVGLAFAAALKGYPAILGMLLIYKRQWKEVLRLIIYGMIAAFGPFLLMEGGLDNLAFWRRNMQLNTEIYEFVRQPKLGYHYFIAYGDIQMDQKKQLRDIWKPIINGLSVLGLVTGLFQKKKWMVVAMLVCIILILPSNCGYYCLLYMFPVLVLYFNEIAKEWSDLIYLPLFLIFFCPFQFIQTATENNLTLYWSNIAIFILFGLLLLQNIWDIIQLVRVKRKGTTSDGN